MIRSAKGMLTKVGDPAIIKAVLDSQGQTYAELAKVLGVSTKTVQRIRKGAPQMASPDPALSCAVVIASLQAEVDERLKVIEMLKSLKATVTQ